MKFSNLKTKPLFFILASCFRCASSRVKSFIKITLSAFQLLFRPRVGDGMVIHQCIYQLSLSADGSVRQFRTGAPDYQNNFGTGTDLIGSWTCRSDGKLVINSIYSNITPITPSANAPNQDIALIRSYRTTALYRVPSDDKLVRIQSRARSYTASEDPTNASGGTLLPISNTSITYNRFIASDNDLLLP